MFVRAPNRSAQRQQAGKGASPDDRTEQAMILFVPTVLTGDKP
jgi:hypothetical protein